jgi:hypothetical protein
MKISKKERIANKSADIVIGLLLFVGSFAICILGGLHAEQVSLMKNNIVSLLYTIGILGLCFLTGLPSVYFLIRGVLEK